MSVSSNDDKLDSLLKKEVAHFCGLSYHTVLRAIKRCDLKATRLGGRIRIPTWALEQWIDENMIDPIEKTKPQIPAKTVPKPPARGSLQRLREIEGGAS